MGKVGFFRTWSERKGKTSSEFEVACMGEESAGVVLTYSKYI